MTGLQPATRNPQPATRTPPIPPSGYSPAPSPLLDLTLNTATGTRSRPRKPHPHQPTMKPQLAILGALLAAATPAPAAAVSTVIGNGADTYLSNDSNSGPTVVHGADGNMAFRYWEATRSRQMLMRFDLGLLDTGSDRTGATLSLTFTTSTRARTVRIYGLLDESLDAWDEAATSYSNAPGAAAADAGYYSYDIYDATTNPTGKWQLLGTFAITNATVPYTDTSTTAALPLDTFLNADTNNLVNFLVICDHDTNASWYVATKENTTSPAPVLTLPNATASDTDHDGLADDWEDRYFGNNDGVPTPEELALQDGTGDPDTDGFANEAEESAESNPTNILSTPLDRDADGLADLWEDQYFGNNDTLYQPTDLSPQSGTGDPDNDNGTNEQEETAATNPTDRASFLDDDGGAPDGLNDWWETFYFGDTATATDPNADNDGDGASNQQEYAALSNPNNIASVPGDVDADGLSDLWEDRCFGNNDGSATTAELALQDGTGDPDADTYTNEQEESAVPVPSNGNSATSIPGNADGDTLADAWEVTHFGTIDAYNGLHDPDGDLYTNEQEETGGSDPTDITSFVDDTDADGINDLWETTWFGNLSATDDPWDDPDEDGYANDDEYNGFSDPDNLASTPEDIDGDGLDDDEFELVFWPDIWTYDGDDDPDRDYASNEEEETGATDPSNRSIAPDTDIDGLGDAWETFSFGDLATSEDPADDNDADGYANSAEYAAATSGSDPLSTPDTDADGLPEGWERFYWTTETTQTGQDDSDGDGASNQLELFAGTRPNDISDAPDPALLSTAAGNGADTYLTNDTFSTASLPGVAHGTENGLESRTNTGVRMRLTMLRFDVSNLAGDLSNTILRLFVTGAPRTRDLTVYGLADGADGEAWDEATTSYNTAPGLVAADLDQIGQFVRDPKVLRRIGVFRVTQDLTGLTLSNPAQLDLKSFIEADTDGLITLVIHATDDNHTFNFAAKESAAADPARAPALVVPNGEIVIPANPRITGVTHNAAADTLTMTVTGLPDGTQFHVESSADLATFTAVAGSTFTADEDPETVVVPANEATDPRRFFRVREGAAP